MSVKAKHVVQRLFAAYCEDLCLLPPDTRWPIEQGQTTPARGVADYIAGMTDRFALLEYRRLFDPHFFATQTNR